MPQMNAKLHRQCLAALFSFVFLLSCFTPAIAFSLENYSQQQQQSSLTDNQRAYNAKPNSLKKTQLLEGEKDGKEGIKPAQIIKEKKEKAGFQWGNLLSTAFKLLAGSQSSSGSSTPLDKMDKLSQLTSGEFSWTKIVSLGLQLILSFFGNDSVALDKMDHSSPLEAFLSAIIAYFTGSNNPSEVSVMAKQATELWGIVVSLLDALRTSFSQRSFEARAIGSNDIMADAVVASTAVLKSYIKTRETDDDICVQKYICEANRDCTNGTGDSGYLFCQMATYAYSYFLESTTYTPFDIISDAGRLGRTGESCEELFSECDADKSEKYF